MNNPQRINPTFYLSVEEYEIDGKTILYSFVPESSQVHRFNDRIFDRNEDGDIDITDNTNLASGLYVRKQGTYTENQIFPFAEVSELKPDLITKARKMASNQRANHPWKSMDDLELLKSAVLPHHRTDAILRRVNLDRYDDRDDIRVNLLESYDRLMQFVSKLSIRNLN